MYNSSILPYLTYCIEIWGNTYESRIRDLVLLQKRAIRIIDNVGYRDHTSTIFKKYRLLKLIDIVHYQTYILMFKANQGNLPVKIQSKFQTNKDVHMYNTRAKDNFFARQNTTRIGKMSVNSKGIELWNVFPKAIKDSVSLEVFKKRARKQLLDKY